MAEGAGGGGAGGGARAATAAAAAPKVEDIRRRDGARLAAAAAIVAVVVVAVAAAAAAAAPPLPPAVAAFSSSSPDKAEASTSISLTERDLFWFSGEREREARKEAVRGTEGAFATLDRSSGHDEHIFQLVFSLSSLTWRSGE